MRTRLLAVLLAAPLAFLSCTNAPESDEAKTTEAKKVDNDKTGDVWKLNTADSKVEWVGTKVTGYHVGNVPLKSGEIYVKNDQVTGGKFVLDIANMQVVGPKGSDSAMNQKLLGHLKSNDFFDVEKNPEGTFELTDVKPYKGDAIKDTTDLRQEEISKYKVTDPTHTVSGNLTLKGVTKNIEFPARITVSGNTAEAIAKFNIDRKDWGIVYPGKPDDLIRDAIHLGISIKAAK
ncbi:MAG TPA: YceI family protein [Chitinophagaceae bacterium]|jgi:polyisoprenoid-binding protein YceI|nr:YceI family protein [Chitinophagaceae bacterium]